MTLDVWNYCIAWYNIFASYDVVTFDQQRNLSARQIAYVDRNFVERRIILNVL